MNKTPKTPQFLLITSTLLAATTAFAQDLNQGDPVGQALAIYGGGESTGGMFGFDLAGMIGAMLFGAVGFIAFVYGKKMSEFKPMAFGAALLAYPYFVKNTLAIYGIGLALCGCLYFFRD